MRPRVSVGMPVFNGAATVSGAIDAVLRQTETDLELVISDNASTDATAELCRAAAARDRRVRYIRQPHNIGMMANFACVARAAQGAYFCWAAADDLRAADFLERLGGALDAAPRAALAGCGVVRLEPDGQIGNALLTGMPRSTAGWSRGRRLTWAARHAAPWLMYGLFRLDRLRPHLAIFEARAQPLRTDLLLLRGLLADGELVFVPAPLFACRAGGDSHRVDRYPSLAAFMRDYVDYAARVLRQWNLDGLSLRERLAVRGAQLCHLRHEIAGRDFWPMLSHLALHDWPALRPIAARWRAARSPALRRLATRCAALPAGTRLALFGGGKHTRRMFAALARSVGRRVELAGVLDDRPVTGDWPAPTVLAGEWRRLRPDVVLVSSDAYEAALWRRARELLPASVAVWTLYGDPPAECDAAGGGLMDAGAPGPALRRAVTPRAPATVG